MSESSPALVVLSRGTETNLVARAVAVQAARRLGGVPRVATGREGRSLDRVLGALASRGQAAVVVPLALGSDPVPELDGEVAGSGTLAGRVHVTRALGAHELLTEVLARRVIAAGARAQDAVVLVAERRDVDGTGHEGAATLLRARRCGSPVVTAELDAGLDGGAPSIGEAVLGLRRANTRVIVAPYLLAENHTARRIRALGEVSGADGTAAALGAHPLVVELVARRYLATLRSRNQIATEVPAA